jgi:hypothetical protein
VRSSSDPRHAPPGVARSGRRSLRDDHRTGPTLYPMSVPAVPPEWVGLGSLDDQDHPWLLNDLRHFGPGNRPKRLRQFEHRPSEFRRHGFRRHVHPWANDPSNGLAATLDHAHSIRGRPSSGHHRRHSLHLGVSPSDHPRNGSAGPSLIHSQMLVHCPRLSYGQSLIHCQMLIHCPRLFYGQRLIHWLMTSNCARRQRPPCRSWAPGRSHGNARDPPNERGSTVHRSIDHHHPSPTHLE